MKAGRVRAKADANQAELVKFIRKMGATFQHTHSIPGALDGILGYKGVDTRIEFKPEGPPHKRKLSDAEQKTFDEWRGRKPEIIQTEEDVLNLIYKINQEKHCN